MLKKKPFKLTGISFISFGFVLFTAIFELIVFKKYREYIFENYSLFDIQFISIKYYLLSIFGYLFCFILLWLFAYLAIISSKYLKPFFFSFLSLSFLYEFTYQGLFGRFSTVQDLSLAMITTNSQSLDAILTYTSFLAFIPCIAFLLLLIFTKNKEQVSLKKSVSAIGIFILVLIGFNLLMFFVSPKFYFYESINNSFGAGSRTLFGYVFTQNFSPETKRDIVEKVSNDGKPQNNIVFVLDESVRGDHLSLNGYERSTTPFLETLEEDNLLKSWGIAASASTRSIESFQHILSGVRFDIDADVKKLTEQMPTLFQYAKAMNYKTFYLDGQLNNYWAGSSGDLEFIDVVLGKKYFDPLGETKWETDFKIAEKVLETVSKSKGNFIIVFKRGNHTPYNNNYPKDNAVWQVKTDKFLHNAFDVDKESFVNSYDNAVRYNVDGFFQKLLTNDRVLPKDTIFLYTSDHGQTLNENGEKYSHGGDTKTQAMVPLFMIGEIEHEIDSGYKASHANIFATLLDLMKFPDELRKKSYAISLLKANENDTRERYFLTPNAMPGDNSILTNQKIKFD